MEFQWYIPPNNSGGSGGGSGEDSNCYKTIRIPVNEEMLSAECRITEVNPNTFDWDIDVVAIIEGAEHEVEVGSAVSFVDYNGELKTAYFQFVWANAFNGYINVNYRK